MIICLLSTATKVSLGSVVAIITTITNTTTITMPKACL